MIIPDQKSIPNNPDETGGDQSSNTQATPTPAESSETTKSILNDEIRSLIRQAVTEATRSMTDNRQTVNDQAMILEAAVQDSQASLMVPNFNDGSSLDYVKKILAEDALTRRNSPDGKARYSESPSDLTKAKIIILKHMGLSDEEIAKSLFDN